VIGVEGARALPIIDMHHHIMQGYEGAALIEVMDRNGVRFSGGAAGNNIAAMQALGGRFIRPAGQQPWRMAHRSLDEASFANPDTPAVQQMLATIEAELRDRGARVVGEIHVNALTTAAEPASRFKVAADSGTLKALFALAGKYGRPLNIHAQWDHSDTVRQVSALAASSPQARLIVSHCGSNAAAADMRRLFERHPNVVCDLSARGWPLQKNRHTVYEDRALARDWQHLIEDFPDRFAVGVDLADDMQAYEASVQAIRNGLLANLTPATAEKVAWRNAEGWLGLR
jgi:predicted TIM-barrel fold metal-dependent hydrolase